MYVLTGCQRSNLMCLNGGSCTDDESAVGHFECECPLGFVGPRCESGNVYLMLTLC